MFPTRHSLLLPCKRRVRLPNMVLSSRQVTPRFRDRHTAVGSAVDLAQNRFCMRAGGIVIGLLTKRTRAYRFRLIGFLAIFFSVLLILINAFSYYALVT
jgi:hypothetical protein